MVHTDTLNVIHARAAGLDVHKMRITATVRVARCGADAEVRTRTSGALPSGIEALAAWLPGHRAGTAVMEGTGIYWEAPYRALEGAGIQPLLPHAQHVKQLKGRKTDVADSLWLARIAQFGLCKPGLVPPEVFRGLRRVSRLRRRIVRERARVRGRIHKLIDAAGLRVGGILSDLFGVNGLRILEGLLAGRPAEAILASLSGHVRRHAAPLCDALSARLDAHGRLMLHDHPRAFHDANGRIGRHERVVHEGLAEFHDRLDLLTTIPGIDRAGAGAILVELGPDIGVFASARHCAAWAGLCPGNNESAGKRRSGRTRRGNTTLREVLVECAHAAARTHDCQFRGYHKAPAVRRGYKRATVATAHKLPRVIHCVLKTNAPYRDPETDYEALMVKRNAPRWIRMLSKYGIDPATGESLQPANA